jgi:hypothetical protein
LAIQAPKAHLTRSLGVEIRRQKLALGFLRRQVRCLVHKLKIDAKEHNWGNCNRGHRLAMDQVRLRLILPNIMQQTAGTKGFQKPDRIARPIPNAAMKRGFLFSFFQ